MVNLKRQLLFILGLCLLGSNLIALEREKGDLQETWKSLIVQELYQQRLEKCPSERDNLGSISLQQIEAINNEGFCEEEFLEAKQKIKERLHTLTPTAAYPNDGSFWEISSLLIEGFRLEDLTPQISSLLAREQHLAQQHLSPFILGVDHETAEFCFAESTPGIPILSIASSSLEPYYLLPINDREKRLIYAIFTTMAEKNIIQLAIDKRTMERKGKRVNHVHPLRFVGYILANPELKSCLKKINKSSFKWDAFIDGFSRRMKEEYSNGNLHVHIPGFCHEVGANTHEVTRFIEKKDWEGLVLSLL